VFAAKPNYAMLEVFCTMNRVAQEPRSCSICFFALEHWLIREGLRWCGAGVVLCALTGGALHYSKFNHETSHSRRMCAKASLYNFAAALFSYSIYSPLDNLSQSDY
jgi:hypothetical protein